MFKRIKLQKSIVALMVASLGVAGCSDSASTAGVPGPSEGIVAAATPDEQAVLGTQGDSGVKSVDAAHLSNHTAFAYVQRSVKTLAQSSLNSYQEMLANTAQAPLDLSSPYDVNLGSKLVVRSSLDVDAAEIDVLSAYFKSADYDVKDVNVSPDGTTLIFAAHGPADDLANNSWNIFEYNFKAEKLRRIIEDDTTANQGHDTNPTYALDGTIVFSSDRSAGNPNSAQLNTLQPDSDCVKVTPSEKPSLLHTMSNMGSNILQLTYGANHDTKLATLKDGNIGFVRWSRSYDLVPECSLTSGDSVADFSAFGTDFPGGLNQPAPWSDAALCKYAFDSEVGPVIPSNHYTVLRISVDGAKLEQLYDTVTVSASDEEFLSLDELVQGENGKLSALLKHEFNQFSGGNLIELQAPDASNDAVFGVLSPRSLSSKVADLYPNQLSENGWYSALWPYRDGTSRYLISWSQCTLEQSNGVSAFCSSGKSGSPKSRFGIWVYDPATDTRLPVVGAKSDVVFTEIAMAQPHRGAEFPYTPFNVDYVDNLDEARIVCPDPGFAPEEPVIPEVPVDPVAPTTPATPVLPGLPVAPVDPVSPTTPVTPVLPVTPAVPVTPVDPATPVVPVAPTTPVVPVDPTTPVNPVVPVDPTTPVNPVVPVDPSTPVNPVVPVDPSTPVNPVVPVDPTTPVNPVVPVDPSTPVNPVVPVDPTTPVNPVVPVDPSTPVNPVVPVDPSTPVNPVVPVDPSTPVNPVVPVDPSTPVNPVVPVDPSTPVNPVVPVDPSTPVNPVVPVDPTTPVNPVVPVDPSTPVNPVVPVDPSTPVNPVVPVDPSTPVNPVVPVDPTTPVDPVTPVDPITPVDPVTPEVPVNTAPVADAGANRSVHLAGSVVLDGSASWDAEGDALTYRWVVTAIEDGSMASLSDADTVSPTLNFVGQGSYVVELVVNDGSLSSQPSSVTITSGNNAPSADAGADRSIFAGELVMFDGSKSSDADGDALTYSWSLVEQPAGSQATLDDETSVSPMLEIDVVGLYLVELTVSDGELYDTDQVVVSTSNNKPVAEAGDNQEAKLDQVVQLDGSESYDADGDSLTYSWNLVSQPNGASASFYNATSVAPSVEFSVPGTYVAQLIVNDGTLNSDGDTVSIFVESPPAVCDTSRISRRSMPFVLRDFKSSHPDFEYKIVEDYGIVESMLGEDGKPVYASSRKTPSTTGASNFNQWYNSVDGVNQEVPMNFELTRVADTGYWEYKNSSFFPLDGLGFGNTRGWEHNYHFTLETHLEFAYKGGEEFTFRGDDDLFLFINGKLAIDIGGVHSVLEKTISLDELADEFGLEPGNTYSFDLFFAERHTVESNFMFQTNINLECAQEDSSAANGSVEMAGSGKLEDGDAVFGIDVEAVEHRGNVVHVLYNRSDIEPVQITIDTDGVKLEADKNTLEFTAPCSVKRPGRRAARRDNVCRVQASDHDRADKFNIAVVSGPDKGCNSGRSRLRSGDMTRNRRR